MAKVFISYRRTDSAAATGRIYDRLVATLGREAIFKDVDNIAPGVNFATHVEETLRQCAVLLVIIGPHWLDAGASAGSKGGLLENPQDWVRLEVETAVKLGLTLMPILVEGGTVPKAEELPASLQVLGMTNAVPVRNDPDFTHDMERVLAGVRRALLQPPAPARNLHLPVATRPTRRGALWIAVVAAVLVVATLGALLATHLPPSRYTGAGAPTATATATRTPVGQWRSVTSPTTEVLSCIAMVSPSEGWALGEHGTILHYTAGQWRAVSSPNKAYLQGIAMVSPSEGWAVGFNGTILHYSGGQWQAVSSPTSQNLLGIAMVSASEGWAVGFNGTILYYSGGKWQVASSPTSQILYSTAMVSASEGWIVGFGGTMLHHSGGGPEWPAASGPVSQSLYYIAMVSASEGWATGVAGTILHYSGGQWQAVSSPTNQTLFTIVMVSPREGWAVGLGGTIVHYTTE
jgi:photosystem II stability/assembly factor-like uncharacterized protein